MIENQPWGKFYAKAFTGSMKGKGAVVIALMAYAVSNAKPPNGTVEMDIEMMAFLIGETEDKIKSGMEVLMDVDPKSRCKAEEGRRLIRIEGNYYRLVNWLAHRNQKVSDSDDKRAYWAEKKRESRARKAAKKKPPADAWDIKTQTGGSVDQWDGEMETKQSDGMSEF